MAIGQVNLRGGPAAQYLQAPAAAMFRGGEGLGQAIKGLANRMQADEEKLRQEDEAERERLENFSARRQYTEMEGRWARSQVDYLNSAPADGRGLTDTRYAQLKAERDEFVKTLPQRLQAEYMTITEGTLQDFATNTYTQEYKLRFNYQTNELTKAAGTLAGEIRAGRSTMEAAQAAFDEVLAESSLPEGTKNEMRETLAAEFAAAQFAQITQEAMQQSQAVRPADGTRPVLSGLLPNEENFLQTVAARESGGDYGLRYDGGKGAKFTDFSDHPRVFVTTPGGDRSSAAGRYMFTASTWDDLVNRHGRAVLPDFSPASQDKAALILARERYHMGRTAGMRSFDELMQNGSDAELLNLKKILAGEGKNTTWEAFQKMEDSEFLSRIRGQGSLPGGGTGSASVPDVWSDPRFAGLSYDTKMKLAGEAQKAVNSINAAALAQQQQIADMLKASIAAGTAGEREVNEAIAQGTVPPKEYDALLNLVRGEREARQAAVGYAQNIAGGLIMDNSLDNQKAALTFMRSAGIVQGLQERSPEASAQLSALFAAGGVLPREVGGLLESLSRSSDPRDVTYALDTLTTMRAKAPDMFAAAVSKETAELEGVWQMARKYSPNDNLASAIEMLKNFRDPAQAAVRETMRKEAKKHLEDITNRDIEKAFDPGFFTSGPSLPLSPQALSILRTDFNKLYETYYPLFGDRDSTTEFVVGQMRHNWGVDSSSGTGRLMYLAPSSGVSGYRPIEGSYNWIREDILKSTEWDENVEFELLSDAQTEAEARSWKMGGDPASYLILRRGDDGLFRTESDEFGLPKRFIFTPDPDIIQGEREAILLHNLEEKAKRLLRESRGFAALDSEGNRLPPPPEYEAIKQEIKELRLQRSRRNTARVRPEPFEENFDYIGSTE